MQDPDPCQNENGFVPNALDPQHTARNNFDINRFVLQFYTMVMNITMNQTRQWVGEF